MKTVASNVENERIHLYLHLIYVKSPDRSAKKEYHSLVSPIVLNGGRFSPHQNRVMKEARIKTERIPNNMATLRLFLYLYEETDQ